MKDKKKILSIVGIVLLIILVVVGTTYAIYTWAMDEDITGTFECFNINYVKGQDIGSDDNHRVFMASSDYIGGISASVIVSTDPKCTITNGTGTLYINTDSSTSSILLTSGALKYQIVENSITMGESGTITSTGSIAIDNIEVTTTAKQFTVYVWLDGNMISNDISSEILSSSYIGDISMRVESGDL